jgi:hypothetical protein
MSHPLVVDALTDAFGAPIRDDLRALSRWPCPLCGGGVGDYSLLPYRPLAVADDGRVWCEGQFDRSWARASCSFTEERLGRALARLERVA